MTFDFENVCGTDIFCNLVSAPVLYFGSLILFGFLIGRYFFPYIKKKENLK